jgi:hypothetical protein
LNASLYRCINTITIANLTIDLPDQIAIPMNKPSFNQWMMLNKHSVFNSLLWINEQMGFDISFADYANMLYNANGLYSKPNAETPIPLPLDSIELGTASNEVDKIGTEESPKLKMFSSIFQYDKLIQERKGESTYQLNCALWKLGYQREKEMDSLTHKFEAFTKHFKDESIIFDKRFHILSLLEDKVVDSYNTQAKNIAKEYGKEELFNQ